MSPYIPQTQINFNISGPGRKRTQITFRNKWSARVCSSGEIGAVLVRLLLVSVSMYLLKLQMKRITFSFMASVHVISRFRDGF